VECLKHQGQDREALVVALQDDKVDLEKRIMDTASRLAETRKESQRLQVQEEGRSYLMCASSWWCNYTYNGNKQH